MMPLMPSPGRPNTTSTFQSMIVSIKASAAVCAIIFSEGSRVRKPVKLSAIDVPESPEREATKESQECKLSWHSCRSCGIAEIYFACCQICFSVGDCITRLARRCFYIRIITERRIPIASPLRCKVQDVIDGTQEIETAFLNIGCHVRMSGIEMSHCAAFVTSEHR